MYMIAKELRDRIVADVSGDLPAGESERLLYELMQSPEARRLHQALQQDRLAIQNLHRIKVDSKLTKKIMAELSGHRPIIRVAPTVASRSTRWPQFVGLALGIGMAFVATWLLTRPNRTEVARTTSPDKHEIVSTPSVPKEKKSPDSPNLTPDDVVVDVPDAPYTPPSVKPVEKPASKSNSDVLTAPALPRVSAVEVVKPRMSLPLAVGDFATKSGRDSFRSELVSESDHRIELFSHDTAKLAEDLQKLIKTKSQTIVNEQLATEALKRKLKTPYAVYFESNSVDDLMTNIRAMARDNRFETLVVMPITDADRRELKLFLGRDPLDPNSDSGARPDGKRNSSDAVRAGGYFSVYPPAKMAGLTKDQASYWDRRSDRSPGKLRLYLILRPL